MNQLHLMCHYFCCLQWTTQSKQSKSRRPKKNKQHAYERAVLKEHLAKFKFYYSFNMSFIFVRHVGFNNRSRRPKTRRSGFSVSQSFPKFLASQGFGDPTSHWLLSCLFKVFAQSILVALALYSFCWILGAAYMFFWVNNDSNACY